MHIKKFFAALLLLPILCAAQTKYKFTKEHAISFALENNKDLKAVKIGIEAANSKLDQSGRLENPSLSAEYGNDMLFNNEGEYEVGVRLSQKFPLLGRLSKEKEISKIDVRLARTEYLEARRALALKTELAYIALQEKIGARKIRERALSHLLETEKNTANAAKAGEVSSLDATFAKSEAARYRLDVIQAKIDEDAAMIELEEALGLDGNDKVELLDSLEIQKIPVSNFSAGVLENRPDYQMFKLAADSSQAEIALINARKFDDVEVGIFYSHGKEVESGSLENKGVLGLAVSVALPFNSFDGSIGEKLANRRQAENRAAAKETSIRNEIRLWAMRSKSYSSAFDEYKKDIDALSKKSLADLNAAYGQGQTDILQVLKTRQNIFELELTRLNITAQQASAVANLRAALGLTSKISKDEK